MADTSPLPAIAGPALRAIATAHGPAYRWMLIGLLVVGSVASMLAATIVNVALPAVIGAYGLGQDQAQWVSSAFLTSSTAFMLLNTWAVASFGVRISFIAAMAVFIAGSLIGASSQSLETLVIGRVLQGAGAGLVQPMAMLLIFQVFPEHLQGTAIGIYSLGVIFSPAFGPVIGGLLIDAFSWRMVFVATTPMAFLAIIGALFLMPTRDGEGRRAPLDWQGLILVMLAIGLTLQGFAYGHREGWDDAGTAIRLTGAAASAIAFLIWESGHRHPILRLSLFLNPAFSFAGLVIMLTGVAVYGSTYLIPLFVQLIQHYSPTGAGQILLPAGLAMAIGFPVAGRLSDGIDTRWLLAAGVIFFGVSMLLLSGLGASTPFWTMAGWVALSRLGIATVMPAANASAMRQVEPQMLAYAAPAATFLTQAGGALGVGGLALLLQERAAFHAAALSERISDRAGQVADALVALSLPFREAGLPPAEATRRAFQSIHADLWRNAEILAFRDCFFAIALAFALLLLVTPLIPGRRKSRPDG